ncbi:uncharacterized protein LOC123532711 [Mercenaria mercenaria]|uniref:uncharacterized protein LOC123532711 n=1 Tax=Mercenaria mercenaria TaxID=6596 RepID=UPI00234FA5B1|nr:uncharacterized protein LOC123532711 [Mercenaria mercenaria]
MLKLQRRKKWKLLFVLTICLFTSIVYVIFVLGEKEIIIGNGENVDISDIKPFEPFLDEDFPKMLDTNPRIPKIIHQTWKDSFVPTAFHENVRSFIDKNPNFKYYFWTDASARQLIADRHPELLETFDNYVEPVRKADMLRYVVLYEFGGIYADLDTECLRPLDRVLNKFSCVISPEPYEHASLIYNTRFMVTNSIMFCGKKHPFLYRLMYNLPSFSHFSQDIDASGPNYVTLQLSIYKTDLTKTGNKLTELHDNFVYVPSSQYFQNEIDPVRFEQFRKMCRNFKSLNIIARTGCVSLKRRGMIHRTPNKYTFTRHSFYHTGYKWISSSAVKITDLVPHAVIYQTV